MSYRIGFVMDQIAGHITNYKNLRSVATTEPGLSADWHEIHYYKEGGAIERLKKRYFPMASTYVSGVLRGTWETRKALSRAKYDALFSNASVGVFFTRTFRRVPTMIDFDSTPLQIDRMPAYGSSVDPKPVAYLKWRLSRDMMQAATLLQAWSEWARQSAIRDYGVPAERVVVNPPGVNLGFWKPAPSERSRATEPLKVLFVGGDFRRKGGDLLLEWYRSQRRERVELHLVTREDVPAGEGVHVYRDLQPNSDRLIRLYQTSDLFVLPSLGECFGIATVEAMAAGLPVIASDVGGTADIIVPGRNGHIVVGNDAAALSRAIDDVLAHPERRRTMGAESRELAEARFDLEKNARRSFGLLKRIADEKRQRAAEAAGRRRTA